MPNAFSEAETVETGRPDQSTGEPREEGEESEKKALAKTATRITYTVRWMEEWYRKQVAHEDATHLMYWRGKFWKGDTFHSGGSDFDDYHSEQNEVFPILDTIVSALTLDVPQCECLDERAVGNATPTRETDPALQGRRVAAPLNLFAHRDMLDDTMYETVLNACIFRKGGIFKVSWAPEVQRVIFRPVMPWDFFFDPDARRLEDAGWAFQRFPLHMDDLRQRIEDGIYAKPEKAIRPDVFPRTLIEEDLPDAEQEQLRKSGLREFVSLVEYWDFRRGFVYHVHADTKQILLKAPIPYGNPYVQLIYHSAVGRAEGISDVALLTGLQRDINELVSARREIVRRLPKRMLVGASLFKSPTEFDAWKNSKTWEPTLVDDTDGKPLGDRVWTTPDMPTSFDFRDELEGLSEHARYLGGMGSYSRAQVENIRTAEEANMIRGAVENRLNARVKKTVRAVYRAFDIALAALRWAVVNAETLGFDARGLYEKTCAPDIPFEQWQDEILNKSVVFRILPFSPLMEDRLARRRSMQDMASILPPDLSQAWEPMEMAREIQELYGWRASVVRKEMPKPPEPPPAPEMPLPGAAPGAMPGAEAGMPALPPEALAALTGAAGMPAGLPAMPPAMPPGGGMPTA